MIYEFVDYFKGIRVGQKIKIRRRHIPPCHYKVVPVHNNFVNYVRTNGNCFVVRSIQVIDDDNAMIGVEEVHGALEIYQVERYATSKRIINSSGK
ncbi:MAG: hypothetical protein WC516_07115 [Patescibacteria group bacterium]